MEQGIFAAGDEATGLTWKRKGFGFTDEDDRLWALGWPHLIYLVPGDATEKELADPQTFSKKHGFDARDTPAQAAPRMLRHVFSHNTPGWLAAIQNPAPLSEQELAQFTKDAVTAHFGVVITYLLEALSSSAFVLDHVIGALEAAPADAWNKGQLETNAGNALWALHFVMRRASEAEVSKARDRLQTLVATLGAAGVDDGSRAFKRLKFVLEPDASDLYMLHFLTPKHADVIRERWIPQIAKMKPTDREPTQGRLVFLGGEPVLEAYAKHVKQWRKEYQAELVEELERCAHPAVVTVMKAVASSRAKKWLKAHGHA